MFKVGDEVTIRPIKDIKEAFKKSQYSFSNGDEGYLRSRQSNTYIIQFINRNPEMKYGIKTYLKNNSMCIEDFSIHEIQLTIQTLDLSEVYG